jgi:hypothetical protein
MAVIFAVAARLSGAGVIDVEGQSEKVREMAACMVMQDHVRAQLGPAGSADFHDCGRGPVVAKISNNAYRVSGFVDSDNGLGGLTRTDYVGVSRFSPGKEWRVQLESIESR